VGDWPRAAVLPGHIGTCNVSTLANRKSEEGGGKYGELNETSVDGNSYGE